jgi:glycosyltransferase involved in cell wall biosynthesis
VKVLILSSGNRGVITPFVKEQGSCIQKNNIEVDYFLIKGKSYKGYLANLTLLKNKISEFKPDLIHAHYGLTALLANFQRKVPVITTFHGSDIWVYRRNRLLSQIAQILSEHSIIVDPRMLEKLVLPRKATIIPCGVDMETFYPIVKDIAFEKTNLPRDKINLLFSSKFNYYEKNYPLAQKTLEILGDGFNIIELDGYTRTEVSYLLNACEIALMTSISEASPQFIKEAMACNCPTVSTDVGDVKKLIGNTDGCYITTFDPEDVAEKVKMALEFRIKYKQTNGRKRIIELGLDSETVAGKVIEVYKKVLKIDDLKKGFIVNP